MNRKKLCNGLVSVVVFSRTCIGNGTPGKTLSPSL